MKKKIIKYQHSDYCTTINGLANWKELYDDETEDLIYVEDNVSEQIDFWI